jgi:signal transduction histidine kinase
LARWLRKIDMCDPEQKWRTRLPQFWKTKEQDMTPEQVIVGHYDYRIVTLSVLIGVIGGYCTIELAERITASRNRARLYWWIGGAIAMAIGTWSMHYTGMLAFRLPMPVQYDWPTTLLAYLASLFASLVGLFVVSRRKMGFTRAFIGSIFMGGGIVALHYTGMASMRTQAMHHYAPPLVALATITAIGFSLMSLWLMFFFREDVLGRKLRKVGSALLLGAAISIMHYIGMASASFVSHPALPDLWHAVPISDLGILGIGAANGMLVVVVVLTAVADRLQNHRNFLRAFSRQLVEVQEVERRHLARELHDEIGQALTAAKINLESATEGWPEAAPGRLQETTAILDRLLSQVRQISLDLRPLMLDDLGLVPALRSLLDQQGRRASVAVRFSAENIPENLDPEIQTTCFRIAQEAITNALRHANATQIDVDLRCENGKLRLLIRDNGIGFDVESVRAQTIGLGLIGIKERAALVGGRAKIISSPDKGTTIEVSLPLTLRARAPGPSS